MIFQENFRIQKYERNYLKCLGYSEIVASTGIQPILK